ncbi:adrenocorticotropic hormone receptor-like [Mytilus trossulus]|uniref:adrenocorticotropic hormone receptor-like n=1 Tax=Mytilus trossulus TaxID=6551 RepID=UPI0030041871
MIHFNNTTENNTYGNVSDEKTLSKVFRVDSYCVPIATILSVISIVGLVTNFIVIVTIASDRKLHQPTFVVICSLAVADFLFLFTRYPRYIIQCFFTAKFSVELLRAIKMILDFSGFLAGIASIVHIVFISVLRYFIIVHPFRSYVLLTNLRVILMTFVIWTLSAGIAILYTFAVLINGSKDPRLRETTNLVLTILFSLLPVLFITTLHVLKANVLIQSISNCSQTVRSMSRIVTIVLTSFIITTTPSSTIDIMIIFGYNYTKTQWFSITSQLAKILLFLNFTVNPFVYFVNSIQFRKSIKTRFARIKHSRGSSTLTSQTNASNNERSSSYISGSRSQQVHIAESTRI